MGKCHNCKKEGQIYSPYMKDYLCRNCFLRMIERRIQKTIHQYDMVKPREKLLIKQDRIAQSKVLLYHLKESAKRMPIEIVTKVKSKKVFEPITATEATVLFLDGFFRNKIKILKPLEKKGKITIYRPFFFIGEPELEEYAKLKKLKFKKRKKTSVDLFLDKILERRPSAIFSVAKMLSEF